MVARTLGCFGSAVVTVAGLAGVTWVLNLPYPMIRWPVAKTAPLILLPSYIKMDHDYRQAVSLVAQADQLVNQATSASDIELGEEKVTQAQEHLDGLPVWFLGYYPKAYCGFIGCRWQFTLDEFETVRAEIGRMEAAVFQERNAQNLLQEGTLAVEGAQQAFQTAASGADRATALTTWQRGMDKLNEIPPETLAGRQSDTKLEAYERDYEQVTGNVAGGDRSNTLVDAAKAFAYQAAIAGQNPPHPAATWERAAELWETAIARLNDIPVQDPGYGQAQILLAEYQANLGIIREKAAQEEASARALDSATEKSTRMLAQNLEGMDRNQIASLLQDIINDLEKVQPNTTSHARASEMLRSANQKLAQLK
ncbi:hypothetical protein VB780_16445 [Leptolyngbya sp. CCNP1308]|uniref:hypothetical protein n=1 Tax=Leptolyngbya sp. CCNP1308 TaxID=3110255 RepID=UPI002B21C04F|nr:hypothetical protein [Leptolyngbya sp. CCNP1308]MEA5450172.1 hypothetical protein [Leptolyngbya sp. CCNP1308]